MDAFVLAGNKGSMAPIQGKSKAFLLLEGRPVFLYILMALDRAPAVDRIYLIGPRKELMSALEAAIPDILFGKRIEVLEQRGSLLENLVYAYSYSLPGYKEGLDMRESPHAGTPGLFLPADIPLITAAEIEEFISNADMSQYDYCMGMTPEASLRQFYPEGDRPGIKMPYLYLREQTYRMNNLHLVRPFKIGAGGVVQKMYDHRHQKYVGNRFKVAWEFFRAPRWTRALSLYLWAQGAVFAARKGWSFLAPFFRRRLPLEKVERENSSFLQTRFKVVETTIGGSALDIDDEESYQAISARFKEWRSRLAASDRTENGECPFKTEACG